MRIDTVEGISQWLGQSGNLFEALMDEVSFVHFGYSARVVFSIVVDLDGIPLKEYRSVVFDLEGVQHLMVNGGLNPYMLEHPEEINWGLSEVARVRVTPSETGVKFEAIWEDERRVEVDCHRAALTVPEELSRGLSLGLA